MLRSTCSETFASSGTYAFIPLMASFTAIRSRTSMTASPYTFNAALSAVTEAVPVVLPIASRISAQSFSSTFLSPLTSAEPMVTVDSRSSAKTARLSNGAAMVSMVAASSADMLRLKNMLIFCLISLKYYKTTCNFSNTAQSLYTFFVQSYFITLIALHFDYTTQSSVRQ